MVTSHTNGITIEVSTYFLPEQSHMLTNEFAFAYKIKIINSTIDFIKLTKRHWLIHDSKNVNKIVEGHGVVGQTPMIAPGDEFQYTSGCVLRSEIGKMQGAYTMINMRTKEQLYVEIPEFTLEADFKKN
jgi:ApaG protein